MKDNLISLQAAIDAGLRLCGRDTKAELINLCEASIADSEGWAGGILDYMGELEDLTPAQPELIEKAAYIRGFEQGRTQGMIDAQERKK